MGTAQRKMENLFLVGRPTQRRHPAYSGSFIEEMKIARCGHKTQFDNMINDMSRAT